jgi:Skp family chaperone for outer membrane proteins
MKIIRMVAASAFVAALLSVSAFAQGGTANKTAATPPTQPQSASAASANVPTSKVALVDTGAFGDEKGGIVKYVNALKSLEREFKPRQDELELLSKKIQAIVDEINKLSSNAQVVDAKAIQLKREEGERLQRELKFKQEEAKAAFQKRYADAIGPLEQDIGKALVAFAKQRGITTLLNIGGQENPLQQIIVMFDPSTDITDAFIADYNAKNPGAAASTTTPTRP